MGILLAVSACSLPGDRFGWRVAHLDGRVCTLLPTGSPSSWAWPRNRPTVRELDEGSVNKLFNGRVTSAGPALTRLGCHWLLSERRLLASRAGPTALRLRRLQPLPGMELELVGAGHALWRLNHRGGEGLGRRCSGGRLLAMARALLQNGGRASRSSQRTIRREGCWTRATRVELRLALISGSRRALVRTGAGSSLIAALGSAVARLSSAHARIARRRRLPSLALRLTGLGRGTTRSATGQPRRAPPVRALGLEVSVLRGVVELVGLGWLETGRRVYVPGIHGLRLARREWGSATVWPEAGLSRRGRTLGGLIRSAARRLGAGGRAWGAGIGRGRGGERRPAPRVTLFGQAVWREMGDPGRVRRISRGRVLQGDRLTATEVGVAVRRGVGYLCRSLARPGRVATAVDGPTGHRTWRRLGRAPRSTCRVLAALETYLGSGGRCPSGSARQDRITRKRAALVAGRLRRRLRALPYLSLRRACAGLRLQHPTSKPQAATPPSVQVSSKRSSADGDLAALVSSQRTGPTAYADLEGAILDGRGRERGDAYLLLPRMPLPAAPSTKPARPSSRPVSRSSGPLGQRPSMALLAYLLALQSRSGGVLVHSRGLRRHRGGFRSRLSGSLIRTDTTAGVVSGLLRACPFLAPKGPDRGSPDR